jgi:protein-disulfide isomerase
MTKRKSSNKAKKSPSQSNQAELVRQRREERKRQQQRRRLTTYAIIVGGVVVLAVIVFILINAPAEAPIPEGTLERYEGITQSQDENSFYVLGDPEAPVRIVEYSSFGCPACKVFFDDAMDDIVDFVRGGNVSYTFIPRFVGSVQNSEGAAKAAFCAGEQGMFFEMHDMLFDWQSAYGNNAFSQNRMVSGAGELGLNTGDFRSCLGSGRAEDHNNTADREAGSRGYTGAPITTVQGVPIETTASSLVNQVNTALSRINPSERNDNIDETTDDVVPEATNEPSANADIAAPIPLGLTDEYADLEQSVTDDGFFRMGSDDAPVIVEDFSSYSCPGCFNWHDLSKETLIEAALGGDVQLIYYPHFTGSVDADNLEDATKAAFCAGEQGAFFQYSSVLYSWHGQFGNDAFDPARLTAGAANLDLDTAAFEDCLASDAATAFIDAARDNVDERNVSSTPTVFINGEELDDLTLDALQAAIASPAEDETIEDDE